MCPQIPISEEKRRVQDLKKQSRLQGHTWNRKSIPRGTYTLKENISITNYTRGLRLSPGVSQLSLSGALHPAAERKMEGYISPSAFHTISMQGSSSQETQSGILFSRDLQRCSETQSLTSKNIIERALESAHTTGSANYADMHGNNF